VPKEFVLHIDRETVKTSSESLNGLEIRSLVLPAIGPDRDLYLEVPGDVDRLVEDEETLKLKNGMHFISAPREITPG
jgi:hypothetical protein